MTKYGYIASYMSSLWFYSHEGKENMFEKQINLPFG